jgi:uncharacterized membrane protein YdjX (TVP38/TMEM64 family)
MASEPQGESDGGARRRLKTLAKGIALIATVTALGLFLHTVDLEGELDRHVLAARLDALGGLGWVAFLLGTGLFTAVGGPRQLPSFLGGYVYGVVGGTLLAALGTTLGSALSFLYARFLGRRFVRRRFGHRIARFESFLAERPFSMTLVIRLMPVGNNLITNLAAGLTRIRIFPFLLGSALGFVPQSLIFAMIGKGTRVDPGVRISIAAALFVVSTLWGLALFHKYRAARVLEAQNGKQD